MGVKVALLTSIFLGIGALVLSFLNERKIQNYIKNCTLYKERINHTQKEYNAVQTFTTTTEEAINTEKRGIATSKESFKVEQNNFARAQDEKIELENKLLKIRGEINDLEKIKADAGVDSLEELEAQIKGKEKRLENFKEQYPGIKDEVVKLREENQVVLAKINEYRKSEAERKAAYRNNSWEGVITAVDNHWGFVVVNSGRNRGIEAQRKLIAMRGNRYVATLNVDSVEQNRCIASILVNKDSGRFPSVQPGDHVIFKKLRSD